MLFMEMHWKYIICNFCRYLARLNIDPTLSRRIRRSLLSADHCVCGPVTLLAWLTNTILNLSHCPACSAFSTWIYCFWFKWTRALSENGLRNIAGFDDTPLSKQSIVVCGSDLMCMFSFVNKYWYSKSWNNFYDISTLTFISQCTGVVGS